MGITNILPLLAGIGIFLLGIDLLRCSLERLVAPALEHFLEMRSSSKLLDLVLGAGIAAAVQSSSTASIMVIGLLSAGIFSLPGAVSVMLGANVGSTLTVHLLRLGELEHLHATNTVVTLLKPYYLGAVLITIGIFLYLFFENYIVSDIGGVLLGLGLIFFSATTMEDAFDQLRSFTAFKEFLNILNIPLLGLVLGIAVAALLRSATTSIGILMAFSGTGLLTFQAMLPLLFGINIGRCSAVLIANFGAQKEAHRAVFLDFLSNIMGTVVFSLGIAILHISGVLPELTAPVGRGLIANYHTLFNLISALVMFPFLKPLAKFTSLIFKEDKTASDPDDGFLEGLNEQLLVTPSLALEQVHSALVAMSDLAVKNLYAALSLFRQYDENLAASITEQEDLVDKYDDKITNYLNKIGSLDLTEYDNDRVNNMMQSSVDWERIADHALNLMEVADYNHQNEVSFSVQAQKELNLLCEAIYEVLDLTQKTQSTNDVELAYRIEPLEEAINILQDQMRDSHIQRMTEGLCNVHTGISFVEVLSNLERISDHCSNVALHLIQAESDEDMDIHDYAQNIHENKTFAYNKAYEIYSKRYNLEALNEELWDRESDDEE